MNKSTPGPPSPAGGGPTVGAREASLTAEGPPGLMPESFLERASAALERLGDRLNPVLVKEVRQALRGRRFVATFMLALFAALVVTLIVLGAEAFHPVTRELRPQAGLWVFIGLYVCFVVIATVLVPLDVYARFIADRAQASVDLVQITRLSSGRIMLGRLEAAGVTLMLYASALVPFSAFSYLLRGLTPGMIAFGVVMTIGAGITMVNFVLFIMAFMPRKETGGLALIACLFVAGLTLIGGINGMEVGRGWLSPKELWTMVGLGVAGLVPLNALLFSLASARTSFASANKETGPRLALFALNVVIVGAMLVGWALARYHWEFIAVMTLVALSWWGLVGIFLLAVPVEMSERVKRSAPRSTLLSFFLWPGRGRAFVFYVANLALLCAPLVFFYGSGRTMRRRYEGALMCAVLYAFAFPPLPGAIIGWVKKRWGVPVNTLRAVVASVFLFFMVHTMLFGILSAYLPYGRVDGLCFLHALSPPFGVGFLLEGGSRAEQLVWNIFAAAVMAVVTLAHFLPLCAKGLAESFSLARERVRERRRETKHLTAEDAEDAENNTKHWNGGNA